MTPQSPPSPSPTSSPDRARQRRIAGRRLLLALIGLCVAIEAVLQLADFRLVSPPYLRALAYQNGAFWVGLLHDWRPNFAAQPVTMFVTYAFLHANLMHLAVNMITLWSLGLALVDRVGPMRFAAIYGVAMLGGGLAFGLLSSAIAPMVGASGALFGLVGAWLAWEWRALRAEGRPPWPVLWSVFWLTVLNVVLWWATAGHLAWETHLGGAVAGLLAGLVMVPTDQLDDHR